MPVERPQDRTVEVLATHQDVDEELLYLYFENKRRSGGGPLASVEKKDDHAILVFEDAEAAARVLSKGHHVVHNVELVVRKPAPKDPCRLLLRGVKPTTHDEMIELYVENMMDVDDYVLYPSPGRDLILIHLSQPLAKDFQNLSSKISKRKLDGVSVTLEQLEQTDSVLVKNLHPGTTADVLTLYFESKRGGDQKVKDVVMLSEGTAKVSFISYESLAPVLDLQHKLDGADLEVKPYFDFLQPKECTASQNPANGIQDITETNLEHVNDSQMQTSPPLVQMPTSPPVVASASSPSSSQPIPKRLSAGAVEEEAVDVLMENQTEETQTLTAHVPVANPAKLALFQRSPLQVQLADPDFKIQVKEDGVHIVGTGRQKLEQIERTISDFLISMCEICFTLEPEKALLFAREDVKKLLQQSIEQTVSPTTIYSVSDSTVVVTSLSQKSAQEACDYLTSQLGHVSMTANMEHEGMLYIKEWTDFLQTLSFTSVKVSERGGNIDAFTLKGMEDSKRDAIMEFLTTPILRESVISMEPGMLKYMQIHCHQLLADMDQVSIFPLEAEGLCGLKICGNAVACQMAEEVLQGIVSSICTRTVTTNAPGVCRFLSEPECRSILNEMETKFQVYISPRQEPWQPLPHQDVFETAWRMMSHRNFQKVAADSAQTNGDGSSDKGLLDEAKRIVSAVDDASTSKQQNDDEDDMDLYTEEEPGSLTDQDPDVIILDDSQLSAEGSAAGGSAAGLSGTLEEEAQLSLAIQYSMESSHWSLEEEEKQLEQALELSRKMNQNQASASGTHKSANAVPEDPNVSLRDTIKATSTLQLDVFAGYSCDLIRVDIAFGKKVSQRQVEEKVEHRSVSHMSEYHKKCLEMIMRKHAVNVQVQGTIITVSGFKDFVPGGMWDVKLLIETFANCVPAKEILKTVQWVQHNAASSDATPYSPDAIVFIENAWRMKRQKVDMLFDNQPHVISFEKMQEQNTATGKCVKISRKMLNLGDLNQDIAEEEYSLLSNMPEATKVDEESDEFQNVVKSFYETIQEYHSKIRIIQVEKLMNRLLYNQYKLKKASVMQRATYPDIERTLYHGTSESSVKEICIHGFNRSFCGKNATVYGQGVYFAVNSALSVQDQYSPPNADGYKYIFVSKVLTGDYTKGCHSMKTAPLKETGEIPLRYDSVTDDITKPTMFVIFNDTQAFPEYLITCQRIHR